MRRCRAGLQQVTPTVLVVFLATAAAAPPGVFVHEHPGGDHAHVHPDDDAESVAHDCAAMQPEDVAASQPTDASGIEGPHAHHGWHLHTQSPFHPAVAPATPALALLLPIAAARAGVADADIAPAARAHPARGPPAVDRM